MESEIIEQIEERLIKEFLDTLILSKLTKGRPISGHDIIVLVNHEFDIAISAETVHSILHSMEKKGLIVRALEQRKEVFLLTDKGKETIKAISSAKQEIINLISNLF